MIFSGKSIKIGLIVVSAISAGLWLMNRYRKVDNIMYEILLKSLLDHSVKEISVSDLVNQPERILLDARAKTEYEVSHIKDAVWVGFEEFEKNTVENIDRDKPIVVYCSVGYRSEKIAEKLEKLGYLNVSNLYGGIFEWINEGNMVVDNLGEATDEIHAYDEEWGIWLSKGKKVFTE
ncbi:MAG: rhodanese-like domain-containing protein [Bacteroidetes bacterium]|nr:rhodanese-like domain-containing protein [Bacteroidota bacterium]MDA1122378.1 rhodanese-like domain-containing protein [Bacteroidota bacterium]